MNIGYHSDFMDRIIERADKRQERMEKMINKMLDKSEQLFNAGKPKPMTNEEWMKSLETEELVDHLYDWRKDGSSVERQAWIEKHKERIKMQIRGWLKEIHHAN